ncbi:hypothetical protein FQR65_LT15976 [Abscondita terminalis]|nr:hypothetical protein FQR65_LT15976 [Abscondita terminalis]
MDVIREEATAAISALPQVERDAAHFMSKNGTKWYKDYKLNKPGPSKNMIYDPLSIFRCLLSEDIFRIIIRETNRKANQVASTWNQEHSTKQKQWKALTLKEFDAFVAIILYAGLTKSNTEPAKELWDSTHAPIFKAALSHDRFLSITKLIRFDNAYTRPQRLQTSKTAAIDDIWLMLQANLRGAYTPHSSLTVDEQLFPYRGRTRFTHYIPSKSAKYGIKVWWLCDSKYFYPLKGMIYGGKVPGRKREINQGQKIVLDLVGNYLGVGRTVYADNFFSTLEVATLLMAQKTAFVVTVRANKTFIPPEFLRSPARPVLSSLFGFHNGNVSLCSYVPKKNKSVILLSTMYYTSEVDNLNKQKPMAILDYNSHKSGVDTMDQMLIHANVRQIVGHLQYSTTWLIFLHWLPS